MTRSVDAVLFDLHFTLVHQRESRWWTARARALAGRPAPADDDEELLAGLGELWARASRLDPDNARDLDPVRHREVFHAVVRDLPGVDSALAGALYATLLDVWVPFPDTLPVLRALRELGVRTAVLSNVGIDVRSMLRRTGIADLVDAVVLSCEHGLVKPDLRLFGRALEAVGVPAHRALMVGDNWRDDAAAAALGVRTLVLPWPPAPGEDLGHRLEGVPGLVAGGTPVTEPRRGTADGPAGIIDEEVDSLTSSVNAQ